MGDAVTPHALMSGPREYRYLLSGIDTLDLAVYVDWGGALSTLHAQLEHERDKAIRGVEAVWHHDAVGDAIIRPSGKRNYRWHIQTRWLQLWIANKFSDANFPTAYVSPSAEALWTGGVVETVERIERVIADLGGIVERIKLSRADLAADFAIADGLTLEFLRDALVSRTRKTNHIETASQLETFYVGARGAPIQARIYNKLLQITRKPRGAFIVPMWGGPVPAWRVEFQLRRPALRNLQLETVNDLCERAGGLWQYLTGDWMSLRLRDNAHTGRRTVHLWWQAVHDCADTFGPACTISRARTGIPAMSPDWYISHMSGCLKSMAACLGCKTIDDALAVFGEKARAYWAQKSWEDAYTRKRIQLGRIEEGGDDAIPF